MLYHHFLLFLAKVRSRVQLDNVGDCKISRLLSRKMLKKVQKVKKKETYLFLSSQFGLTGVFGSSGEFIKENG